MPEESLKDLYIDELKDLYSAENQLIKALPKMAKAASSPELRSGFEEHLEQTKGHAQRLECGGEHRRRMPRHVKTRQFHAILEIQTRVVFERRVDANRRHRDWRTGYGPR